MDAKRTAGTGKLNVNDPPKWAQPHKEPRPDKVPLWTYILGSVVVVYLWNRP